MKHLAISLFLSFSAIVIILITDKQNSTIKHIVLTLDIQCSSMRRSISKAVDRHTSIFPAVCFVRVCYT